MREEGFRALWKGAGGVCLCPPACKDPVCLRSFLNCNHVELSLSLSSSSYVPVFSPVWCDSGDLRASPAVVLHRLRRTVSWSFFFVKRRLILPMCSLSCFSTPCLSKTKHQELTTPVSHATSCQTYSQLEVVTIQMILVVGESCVKNPHSLIFQFLFSVRLSNYLHLLVWRVFSYAGAKHKWQLADGGCLRIVFKCNFLVRAYYMNLQWLMSLEERQMQLQYLT